MKDGRPVYTYNYLGLSRYTMAAKSAVPAGPATVQLRFAYDGGGMGKGGVATLSVNGNTVAEGRIEKTQPLILSADETADVGLDNQTPVAEGINVGAQATRFAGTIRKVTIELKLAPSSGEATIGSSGRPDSRRWAPQPVGPRSITTVREEDGTKP